jgi:hypothetical protein
VELVQFYARAAPLATVHTNFLGPCGT